MISWMLIALFYLCLWHLLVEAAIVPCWRARVRLRLFALRDALRSARIDGIAREEEFEEAQKLINNMIRLSPRMDPFTVVQWSNSLKSNKELAERIEKRRAHFDAIASNEVKSLIDQGIAISQRALTVNSLGWVVYLIPILVVMALWQGLRGAFVKMANATEYELNLFTAKA